MSAAAALSLLGLVSPGPVPPAPYTPAVEASGGVSWQLDNGLRVVVLPDRRTPVVAVHVAYHVGARDEPAGLRGIAHLFEHLMFKGSRQVAPEQHANLVKAVGGQTNAVTVEDITVFQNSVPAAQLPLVLRLEADRMRGLILRPSDLRSERAVVLEERAMRVDDDPLGRAIELLRRRLFPAPGEPYGWVPVGEAAGLRAITLADCRRFYDAHYRPGNATLVIAGDADVAVVRQLVRAHFASLAAAGAPPAAPPAPAQPGGRPAGSHHVVEMALELPLVIGGYRLPAADHPDVPALRVLASLFAGGESSRIHRRLVRHRRLALSAGGLVQTFEQAGLLMWTATPAPGRPATRFRHIVAQEAARLRRRPVGARELAKAKNQLEFDWLEATESSQGLADEAAQAQYLEGDWRRAQQRLQRIRGVNAADVRRVARAYLRDQDLVTVLLRAPSGGVGAGALPAPRRVAKGRP
jgi:zinc protease